MLRKVSNSLHPANSCWLVAKGNIALLPIALFLAILFVAAANGIVRAGNVKSEYENWKKKISCQAK